MGWWWLMLAKHMNTMDTSTWAPSDLHSFADLTLSMFNCWYEIISRNIPRVWKESWKQMVVQGRAAGVDPFTYAIAPLSATGKSPAAML